MHEQGEVGKEQGWQGELIFEKKKQLQWTLRDHKNMRSAILEGRVRDAVGFRDF